MEDSLANAIKKELIRDVAVRLFDENTNRIKKCLSKLTSDQIWWRPNENSNSIGNLVLHLNGNVRQWILSGIDGQPDTRKRQSEFDTREPHDSASLVQILDNLELDTREALNRIKPSDLIQIRPVQIYEESGISILVHVTEHFSFHTGQITYITKMLLDDQVQYYAGIDLG